MMTKKEERGMMMMVKRSPPSNICGLYDGWINGMHLGVSCICAALYQAR